MTHNIIDNVRATMFTILLLSGIQVVATSSLCPCSIPICLLERGLITMRSNESMQ
jgi:hypothetical protein